MRHYFSIVFLVALAAAMSSCTPYMTNAYLGPRFDPGPDPGQFYNPRHDYSRPQIFPGTINTYTGQIVPAGGAFAWGGYRWGWNAQARAYQPIVVQQQSTAADSMRGAAEMRYLDMRTESERQKELVRLLGSRRYRLARDAVRDDLDQLGGLSALSAELMGFKPNSTVEHVPTTSAPLEGTDGAERHSRQAGQQPAVFSDTAGQRLAKVVTQQRIDSLRRAPAVTPQPAQAAAAQAGSAAYERLKARYYPAMNSALQALNVAARQGQDPATARAAVVTVVSNFAADPDVNTAMTQRYIHEVNTFLNANGLEEGNWFLRAANAGRQ